MKKLFLLLLIPLLCTACSDGGGTGADNAYGTAGNSPDAVETIVPIDTQGAKGIIEVVRVTPMIKDRGVIPEITPSPSVMPVSMPDKGISILVEKALRQLTVYKDGEILDHYAIGLGFSPEGDKQEEGDGRTPEGEYYICTRNDKSRFYLSLGLSYPSKKDAERGLSDGLIDQKTYDEIVSAINKGKRPPWDTALGGEIMIHGEGSSSDWTAGCIAVDNDVMDVLFEKCTTGTYVLIVP